MSSSLNESSKAVVITRGAGAILNLHVVYTGWKFPSFILSETDEAYLFELMVCPFIVFVEDCIISLV